MFNKKTSLLFATLTCALLTTGSAQAQAPAPAPWVVACQEDMNKHCAAEVKANGDVRPCLAKNEATLSQQCKDVFLRKYKILEMCKDDIEKVCAGTTDGKALGKCFNEKQDQLSAKCKSALTKGTKEHAKEAAAAPAAGAPDAGAPVEGKGKKKKAKKAEKAEKAAAP